MQLTLDIVQAGISGGGGGGGGTQNYNTGKGISGGAGSMLNLPNITAVSKDDWDIHGFDELNVLKVVHVGTGEDPDAPVYDFFINTDNKYLLHSQKGSPNNSELLRKQFIYGFVLVGLALLQEHQKKGTTRQSRSRTMSCAPAERSARFLSRCCRRLER